MAELDHIAQGTVMRLMPYGALVRLDDGSSGLVHISEIDDTFVSSVADYLHIGQRIVVKVLARKDGGKLEFSLKRAKGTSLESLPVIEKSFAEKVESETELFEPDETHHHVAAPSPGGARRESRAIFDEKMREFLADSTERLGDLKKHQDHKLNRRHRA